MGFYYFSLFSLIPLGVAYGVLAVVFLGVVLTARRVRARALVLAAVGALFLVLPISEELWIAWNFGQACKEAGTFIHKKVLVEGFYDDTTHWWRQLQDSQYMPDTLYQFVESRDPSTATLWRVERVGNEIKHFRIERPSARYHFRMTDPMDGTPWGHKIIRFGSAVFDTETNQEIARYVGFGRGPAWYFIGLDVPGFACDSPGNWPYTRKSLLVYREALIPVGQK